MKKLLAVVLMAALGLAVNAYAQSQAGTTVEKVKTTTQGGVTTTKAEVKDTATGAKAKEEIVKSGDTTYTKQDVKAKGSEMKRETLTTPAGEAGLAKVTVKKGAISNMQIEWTYHQEGNDYITEYTIKDKTNKDLQKELNLTPMQASLIQPGLHRIVSTSPFTGEDIRNNIRSVILQDIKSAAAKRK